MNRREYRKHLQRCSNTYYERIKELNKIETENEEENNDIEDEIFELYNKIEEVNELLDDLDENYGDYNYIPYDYTVEGGKKYGEYK